MPRKLAKTLVMTAILAMMTGSVMAQEGTTPPPAGSPQPGPAQQLDDAMRRMLTEGARGSLAVQVVQGTAGGPVVGDVPVSVDLYHQNTPVWQTTTTVDPSGVALLADLPVALAVRPVVQIKYDGVSYLEIGPALDESNPDGAMKLTVYQTTHDEPAWHVAMRHIMVQRVTDGTIVNETLVIENPADQTWFGGEPMGDDQGTTVRVSLPELVTQENVRLDSGFHGWCCTTFTDRELAVQMPLMPGRTTYMYTYFIPTQPDRVDLNFAAGAPTDSVAVFVPDDGTDATTETLELQGTQAMGKQRMRSYIATDVAAGQEAAVVLTSLRSATEVTTPSAPTTRPFPWMVVIVIGGIVVVGIVGVIVMRGREL